MYYFLIAKIILKTSAFGNPKHPFANEENEMNTFLIVH